MKTTSWPTLRRPQKEVYRERHQAQAALADLVRQPDDPDMTALYIERYMNWASRARSLQSGKPLIA
jgi:hypothetical protein